MFLYYLRRICSIFISIIFIKISEFQEMGRSGSTRKGTNSVNFDPQDGCPGRVLRQSTSEVERIESSQGRSRKNAPGDKSPP